MSSAPRVDHHNSTRARARTHMHTNTHTEILKRYYLICFGFLYVYIVFEDSTLIAQYNNSHTESF